MHESTIWCERDHVFIIDQTLLPLECKRVEIRTCGEMWEAIRALRVRGAPAIGIAAAFGIWLGIRSSDCVLSGGLIEQIDQCCDYMATARPTAVNLFWAVERIRNLVHGHAGCVPEEIKELVLREAQSMIEEDNAVCLSIGRHGAGLVHDGCRVLTHCNAGGLATARYGTALAPVYYAMEKEGRKVHVYADETRPLLQGARLTAWELKQAGIPVTLICDNMAASVMRRGLIDIVIVGTDRVARNGDFANKIGTYGVAVLAHAHNIPFYAAAPLSSIDLTAADGAAIPIEERDPDEVTRIRGIQIAPDGIDVFNPAFDVTPCDYVTGFITEKGIARPPFDQSIPLLFQQPDFD
ncbi:MAG: S-methyl-5-thioribose-1-phosphate isomerase [Candidatus Sumerlaeota bacterium]|nr:S-methyl-5-thioribose-1-phosphate isomerase [Candidatus Sumerlaeota bacterium]